MSHFVVMVIGEDPEDQLEPYNENTRVPEYGEPIKEDDKERMVDFYRKHHPEDGVDKMSFEEVNEKYGQSWNGGAYRKDENGVWMAYSTYNPNSKWDWYSLGGRWSGLIKLKEDATSGITGESGVFGNEVGIDQAKLGDIENIDEIKPFAIVKDGKWYERGRMGWWAMVSDAKDDNEWDEEVLKLLSDLPADTLISIYDCHI